MRSPVPSCGTVGPGVSPDANKMVQRLISINTASLKSDRLTEFSEIVFWAIRNYQNYNTLDITRLSTFTIPGFAVFISRNNQAFYFFPLY